MGLIKQLITGGPHIVHKSPFPYYADIFVAYVPNDLLTRATDGESRFSLEMG